MCVILNGDLRHSELFKKSSQKLYLIDFLELETYNNLF